MRPRAFALASALLITASAVNGCGFRIVRRSDITAQRFAADSATMVSLERQIVKIQAQCRADSLRAAANPVIISAPAIAAPVPDSLVKARDTEIAMLKDQLTRANAELDRIKRRLANPRS